MFPSELLDAPADVHPISPSKREHRRVGPQKRLRPVKGKKKKVGSAQAPSAQASDVVGHDNLTDQEPWGGPGGSGGEDVTHTDGLLEDGATCKEEDIEMYVEAVESSVAGFVHIYHEMFVVQGWDVPRNRTTVREQVVLRPLDVNGMHQDLWYHLEYQKRGDDIVTACSCPKALAGLCIHQLYFKEYSVEQLVAGDRSADPPPAALFLRQLIPALGLKSLISVESMSSSFLKGRAVVTHIVSRKGGSWKCSKDTNLSSCYHITKAQASYPEPVGEALEAALEGADIDCGSDTVDVSEIGECMVRS